MAASNKIYFRADGNAIMGLGHIIRSLALAEMVNPHFECHFLVRSLIPLLKDQIATICCSIIELPENNSLLEEANYIVNEIVDPQDIIVLDGYHFRTDYQSIIKSNKNPLVCIDDIFTFHFMADIIINHAGGVEETQYSAEPSTKFLLGLQYALMRKEFRDAAKNRNDSQKSNNLFICLGGADPHNTTLEVIQLVQKKWKIDTYYIVLGQANKYKTIIKDYVEATGLNAIICHNLSASEMVTTMQSCQKAITTPSTVAYEYLCIGGELYLKVIADNQLNINSYFIKSGLAFRLEDYPIDKNQAPKALQLQKKMLDGNMDKRLIKAFKSL